MKCSYIAANDRWEGKGGGGERRGGGTNGERSGWEERGRRQRRGIAHGWRKGGGMKG